MKWSGKPGYKFSSVLLVDDNELDNFINHKTMEAHHFAEKVYTVTNGKSAIDFIRNLLKMENVRFPEIIFVDLNMPLMDGFQFIEYCHTESQLKAKQFRLAVLTSSVNEADRKKVESYGKGISFLQKPLTEKMLEELAG